MASMVAAVNSPSTIMNTENMNNGGGGLGSHNQQVASNSSLVDVNDSAQEVKTEFYTREGIWKLMQGSGEYSRQIQSSQQQQFQQSQTTTQIGGQQTMQQGLGSQQQQNGSNTNLNGTGPEIFQEKLFNFLIKIFYLVIYF